MSQIGALNIAITADGSNAIAGMGQVDKQQKSLGESISKNAKRFAKWGAIAATAAAGIAVALTRSNMKSIDELAKLSRAVDGTIDSIQALKMAAGDSGLEGLEQSLARMNRRLGAAELGAGAAAVTVKALNLDLQALGNMDIDQRLQTIAHAIDEAGMSSEQAARHLQNLGFEQATAVEFFRSGISDLSEYKREIDSLGLSLSAVDAAKIEQANDSMAVFGDVIRGIGQQMAVTFSPLLKAISDQFLAAAMESGGFGDVVQKVFDGIITGVKFVSNYFAFSFRSWSTLINGFVYAMGGISKAWAAIGETVSNGIQAIVQGATNMVNALIRQINRLPKVDIDELADPQLSAEWAQMFDEMGDRAETRMADAQQNISDTWSKPWPSEAIDNFVSNAIEASERAAQAAVDARNTIDGVSFTPVNIEEDAAVNDIRAALMSQEQELTASYSRQVGIIESERQKRLDVIQQYNQQEQAMLSAQGDVAEYQSQADDIRAKKQRELAAIQDLEAAKEAALRALPAIDAYTSQAEWIREKKEEELAVIEQLEAAKAHMLETGADDTHVERIEAQLQQRLAVFENYAQQESQVMGMISEAQTFGGVEMDLAAIEEKLSQRLELVSEYQSREQELLAQVQEAQARGGSEEDIAELRQEREALLDQIQHYNDLELQLEEQHAEALRGIVQGDEKYSREANEAWLNGLRERNMTELELLELQAELEQERLLEALEQELLTREEYNALMNESDARAAEARTRIAESEARARTSIISNMMTNLSQLMNAGSRKMFAIGKAAAVSQALIAGKEAVVNSYNAGTRIGGPPVGAAFAATAATATAGQIKQIRSQSFGGGSNPTTFSGGLPAMRTVNAGQSAGPVNPSQRVDINITGSGNTFSADQVRDLIRQINEQVGDGVNVAFSG